ncbi:recombinase RecT [Nocardia cyriacigeorgica]|uniref:recombinase RecT n=1 Tax=Nocardia cyriacigeorgica TaxID=135487 RepID=UPI0018952B08|nr:RecT family recombinase [Nocardia cyriacigeorgica]MBF6085129.1 recombinase RecT [Nocardia cyriacigeorgica]
MSEISKEVAKQANPLAVVAQYQRELGNSMPAAVRDDVPRWLMVAEMAVRKDPKLLAIVKADQGASLMRALLECARLGHEPGTDHFYLVPRGNTISGEEGYKGIVKRILNSGYYQRVVAQVVHEHDEFDFDPVNDTTPYHVKAEGERGRPVQAYAFAVMWDGTPSTVAVATPERIAAAKAKSFGTENKSSPWQSPTGVMYRKTAIRELAAFVHTSAEPRGRVNADGEPTGPADPATPWAMYRESEADSDIADAEVIDITAEQIAAHEAEAQA